MKRPLVWIFLFFVCGIIMGRYIGIPLFFAVVLIMTSALYARFRLSFILGFPVAAMLGFILLFSSIQKPVHDMDGSAAIVRGIVINSGRTGSQRFKAIIQTDKIICGDIELIKRGMKVIIYSAEEISLGEKVFVTGKIYAPYTIRNPGGFDESEYFNILGVSYKIFPDEVQRIGYVRNIGTILSKIRGKISAVFDEALPQKESGIMKAMIIGDKNGLDEDTKVLYKKAGIYHILAISGLHVSILAMVLENALSKLLKNKSLTMIILSAFLIFYCILTGSGAATVRAVIMSITYIIGKNLKRKLDPATTTSFAAFLMLLYKPLYLWDVGFQYSFTAVYALGVLSPILETKIWLMKSRLGGRARKHHILRTFLENDWLDKYVSSTVSVSLMTFPITIMHFYSFSPISLLLNLFVIPSVFVVITAGFSICVTGLFFVPLSKIFGVICVTMIKFYDTLCSIGLKIPFSYILTGKVPSFFIGFYFVLVFLAFYALNNIRKEPAFMKIPIFNILMVGTAVFAGLTIVYSLRHKDLEICMLDVGQGDCIVVSKGKSCIVIDGGGKGPEVGNNTGENIIAPYLDYKGIGTIDAVFLSHLDSDHAVGIIEIMPIKCVKRLFLSYPSMHDKENEFLKQLTENSKINNTALSCFSSGDEVSFLGIKIKCLFPDNITDVKSNNASLVFKLDYGDVSLMFTGDIHENEENTILKTASQKGWDVRSDVLKAAHHGSRYSTSEQFIREVMPKIAIISAGANNYYRHPSPETVKRLEDSGAKVYVTAQTGAIIINSDGENLHIKTMLNH